MVNMNFGLLNNLSRTFQKCGLHFGLDEKTNLKQHGLNNYCTYKIKNVDIKLHYPFLLYM